MFPHEYAHLCLHMVSLSVQVLLLSVYCCASRAVRGRLFLQQLRQLGLAGLVFGIPATIFSLVGDRSSSLLSLQVCPVMMLLQMWGRSVCVVTQLHVSISFASSILGKARLFRVLFKSLLFIWPICLVLSLLEVWEQWALQAVVFSSSSGCLQPHKPDFVGALFIAMCVAVVLFIVVYTHAHSCCKGHSRLAHACRSFVYVPCFLFSQGSVFLILIDPHANVLPVAFLDEVLLFHLSCSLTAACFLLQACYVRCTYKQRLPSLGLRQWEASTVESFGNQCQADLFLMIIVLYLEGHDFESDVYCLQWNISMSTDALESSLIPPPEAGAFSRSVFAPVLLKQIFLVEACLYAGTYGNVYVARARANYDNIGNGGRYCLKHLVKRDLGEQIQYAFSERDILASASHCGIVRFCASLQVLEPTLTYVLVMEYCSGGDLKRKLDQTELPSVIVSRRYAAEVLQALGYLHSIQILHRDLKPSNVLLTARDRCKITDFGLSKASTTGTTFCGTAGYLAPEVTGSVPCDSYGPAADIYSWGMLVMDLFVGLNEGAARKRAFRECEAYAIVTKATHDQAQCRSSIAELQKDPFFRNLDFEALLQGCMKDDLDN
eukprot:TRINITY_DN11829_c0_g1_i1.p1 TRINITY_DN11829_c0_g1~~TRINITY_DN11829_c0_g1_i1.p1  ORF type:complete len:605 (-),score=48.24 TRINITY_DN11829_c0_g1_i1:611-2425(-)